MPRGRPRKDAEKTYSRPERSFSEMMRDIPTDQFVRMVTRCSLPAVEARELCQSFKELKQ